jgi:hypothetical protein
MLGLYLGDGCKKYGAITTMDYEVLDYVSKYAKSIGYHLSLKGLCSYLIVRPNDKSWSTNRYRDDLSEINVLGNKHIPGEYLIDSYENRIQLLAGLLDTDGHLEKGKKKNGIGTKFEIVQKNERLAKDIVELARSLNFYTSLNTKIATMKRKDGTIYRCPVFLVAISGKLQNIPTKIERKKATNCNEKHSSQHTGFKIEPIGIGEYYGFAVDDNHLFLLEDGTVVHNSYRGGSVTYLKTIYTRNCQSGIQSKTKTDAEDIVFKKKIVEPYKDLPDFFVPINDNTSNPETNLSFHAPSRRGKNSAIHRQLQRLAIRSGIDSRASGENAYDGETINGVLLRDEEGKLVEANISKRHKVTVDCVWRDGRKRGNIYSTTTIEEMDKGGKNYKKLWDTSDPRKVNELGETTSRLRRIFQPAYKTAHSDEFGYPDEVKAKREQLIRRKELAGNPRELLAEILQHPWTEDELFKAAGTSCQYNLEVLRQREQIVNDPDYNEYRIGKFFFTNGVGSPVKWEDDQYNGHWHCCFQFENYEKEANRVLAIDRGNDKKTFHPLNDKFFSAGFDPTKTHSSEEKRRSMAGGVILMKPNFWLPDISPNFVADYIWQPTDPEEAYLEFLAGCWYFGCRFLPESNLGINHVIKSVGCWDFIMNRPEKSMPNESTRRAIEELGVPSNVVSNDLLLKNAQTWMHKYAYKIKLPRIVNDSINFDPAYRTKYDLEVAKQLALMAAEKKNIDRSSSSVDLAKIFTNFTQPKN